MKAGIAKTAVRCNNCGADDARVVTRGVEHEYDTTTSDTFDVVRCGCGLLYLNPRPAVSELSTIYPPDYYSYNVLKRRTDGKAGDRFMARLFRRRNLARYRPYAELVRALPRREQRILDVGCADGSSLNWWRDALLDVDPTRACETHGVEMGAAAAEVARSYGHQVIAERLEDAPLPGKFDFAYSFHVIEHVEDPTGFMAKLRSSMHDDGYLLVDTPNIDSLDHRLFGKHWGGYHFPRHWTLYDPKTFTALAEKTGFTVERISYYPAAIFWVWTLHSMLKPRATRLANTLFPPVDIFTRGSLWTIGLLSAFTIVDMMAIGLLRRSSCMRILLRPKR